MTIEEFLIARIEEFRCSAWFEGCPMDMYFAIQRVCDSQRFIIEWHKNWPVFLQTPPAFEMDKSDPSNIIYRMTSQMEWVTQEEYRNRFGSEPPTAPLLRQMASLYQNHSDYNEEWNG